MLELLKKFHTNIEQIAMAKAHSWVLKNRLMEYLDTIEISKTQRNLIAYDMDVISRHLDQAQKAYRRMGGTLHYNLNLHGVDIPDNFYDYFYATPMKNETTERALEE